MVSQKNLFVFNLSPVDNDYDLLHSVLCSKLCIDNISGIKYFYLDVVKCDISIVNYIQDIINSIGKKIITDSIIDLSDNDLLLLNIIRTNLKVVNKDPSEIWFSLLYNGMLSVNNEVTDIIVNNKLVSLKCYTTGTQYVIDMGSLPNDKSIKFRSDINLICDLLSIDLYTSSVSRYELQSLVAKIDSTLDTEIKSIISIGKQCPIKLFNYISNKLYDIVGNSDTPSIVLKTRFVSDLNEMIYELTQKVDYWCIILNGKLYIISANKLYEKLKSDVDQCILSTSISTFRNNRLRISITNFKK